MIFRLWNVLQIVVSTYQVERSAGRQDGKMLWNEQVRYIDVWVNYHQLPSYSNIDGLQYGYVVPNMG